MTEAERIDALVEGCSEYERQFATELAEGPYPAREVIIRHVLAELQCARENLLAVRPTTAAQKYVDAMQAQRARQNRRAELAESVIDGTIDGTKLGTVF